MPRGAAIRHTVAPRDVPPEKAARRLHLTIAQFDQVRDQLYGRGFPRPDVTTGMYDLAAIEAWMNNRSGLAASHGLTPPHQPRNAQEVSGERMRRMLNG